MELGVWGGGLTKNFGVLEMLARLIRSFLFIFSFNIVWKKLLGKQMGWGWGGGL